MDYVESGVPPSLKSGLFQLGSILDLDCSGVETTLDFCQLIEDSIRIIERIKHESTQKTNSDVAKSAGQEENQIASRAKKLEADIKHSLKSIDDVTVMKSKTVQLSDKLIKEKHQRHVLEKFIEAQNIKMNVLVNHIEKLMKALKAETAKTVRSLEINRKARKDEANLNAKLDKQTRAIATQNRFIAELSEGSKVLEDQLKLMDVKYLEQRLRIDNARTQFTTQSEKLRKENSDLRLKYALANNGALLDTVDHLNKRRTDNILGASFGNAYGSTEGFLKESSFETAVEFNLQQPQLTQQQQRPSTAAGNLQRYQQQQQQQIQLHQQLLSQQRPFTASSDSYRVSIIEGGSTSSNNNINSHSGSVVNPNSNNNNKALHSGNSFLFRKAPDPVATSKLKAAKNFINGMNQKLHVFSTSDSHQTEVMRAASTFSPATRIAPAATTTTAPQNNATSVASKQPTNAQIILQQELKQREHQRQVDLFKQQQILQQQTQQFSNSSIIYPNGDNSKELAMGKVIEKINAKRRTSEYNGWTEKRINGLIGK